MNHPDDSQSEMQDVIYDLRDRLSRLSRTSLRIAVALPFLLLYTAWAIPAGTLRSWNRKGVEPWQPVMLAGNVGAVLYAFLVACDQFRLTK